MKANDSYFDSLLLYPGEKRYLFKHKWERKCGWALARSTVKRYSLNGWYRP